MLNFMNKILIQTKLNGDDDFRLKFFSLSFVSVYSPSVKSMLPHNTSVKIPYIVRSFTWIKIFLAPFEVKFASTFFCHKLLRKVFHYSGIQFGKVFLHNLYPNISFMATPNLSSALVTTQCDISTIALRVEIGCVLWLNRGYNL